MFTIWCNLWSMEYQPWCYVDLGLLYQVVLEGETNQYA